jgi:hypothetical protein
LRNATRTRINLFRVKQIFEIVRIQIVIIYRARSLLQIVESLNLRIELIAPVNEVLSILDIQTEK